MGSPAGKLAKEDWVKQGRGLGIALAGAVVAAIIDFLTKQAIPQLQENNTTITLILAVVCMALVNFLRKWLTDTRPTKADVANMSTNTKD